MRPLIDDIESRNKVRKCSLVPLTIATAALAELGVAQASGSDPMPGLKDPHRSR